MEASRFGELLERRICESSVEERRGRVATVCMAILRIDSGRSSSRRVDWGEGCCEGELVMVWSCWMIIDVDPRLEFLVGHSQCYRFTR